MTFKTFLSGAFLLLAIAVAAQNPSRVTLKGVAQDSSGEKLIGATVMLLNHKDSSLVNFTRSDENGAFAFKSLKNSPYVLKITYVGYLPHEIKIQPTNTELNDLGLVTLKPIATELMEVVVKAAKAPLRIRGDTIEYDATTFKVPPGSTVEDLLRRLPGIEVDADGNIKAQGKDVKNVYVDGKTFFGNDPKSATRNLGAETISKVQVYNESSEQSKLTGVEDGKKDKALNLSLKEEYKKGSFGKITVAGGTQDRWALRGNFNKFNEKQQLSFIGFGNNINETGVNWQDYGEFKGQNAYNGNDDDGDFGFGGGMRYYYMGGEDSPLNNFDGRGFTENYGGGINYNYDNKKTKGNLSYFYNQTDLNLDQYSFRESFFDNQSLSNTDTLTKLEFRYNHNLNGRIEQNLDSNNIVILKGSLRISGNDLEQFQNQLFTNNSKSVNQLTNSTNSDLTNLQYSGSAIYRHKFKKKGRSFAISGSLKDNTRDGSDNLFNINKFFEANSFTEQIRQLNTNNNNSRVIKSSALVTEPVSKKIFYELFGNYSTTQNDVNRQVTNPGLNNERIDTLSIYFDNKIDYLRAGNSLRYSHEGINVIGGLAVQRLSIYGQYAPDKGRPYIGNPVDRKFTNVIPYFEMVVETDNNMYFSADYNYSVREPQFSDLQPVPNVNNPLFRVIGNPDLTPERSHAASVSVNYWNPSSLGSFGISMDGSLFDNRIVYNQVIEFIDSIGLRTTTTPANIRGGKSASGYLWSNFPIIKTKLTLSANGSYNYNQSPALVNSVKNLTNSNQYSLRVGLSLTPGNRLILGVNGRISNTDITYSINESQNQKIINESLGANVKWQFLNKWFFESNFDYSLFKNDLYDFKQELPIFNASVRTIIGKNNRWEARLAGFDLLNKRVYVVQNGTQNFVSRTVANTLARYFMLSVSYNVRGYENKLNKNNWW